MKTQGITTAAIVFLLAVGPAVAETLEPFQPNPADKAAWPFRVESVSSGSFVKPAPDSGTVHPQATVTTFQAAIGTVSVAVDATSPEALQPDLVRFDLSGTGKFNNRDVAPLEGVHGEGYYNGKSKPVPLSLERDGRTIYVMASAMYYKFPPNRRTMQLELVIAGRGTLQFGGQARDVVVFDGNSNLKLGDLPKLNAKFPIAPPCDTVLIAGADGKFDSPDAHAVVLGQPVSIGEALYAVQVGEDGWTASAVPFDGPVGMIQVAHQHWECLFVGQEHVVRLAGGDQPQPVPADSYVAVEYTEWTGEDHGPKAPSLKCEWRPRGRGAETSRVEVAEGQVTAFAIGSPLAIEPLVKVKGRAVTFDASIADTGRTNDEVAVTVDPGRTMAEPKVVVYDAGGKEIYTGAMQFG